MTSTVQSKQQRLGPSRRRSRRGGAMVEFAIMTPVLIALLLWASYFWEVSLARLKGVEVARFVAFERTVRGDLPAIVAEAQKRYQDLDGSTPDGNRPKGFINGITLSVNASLAEAPLSGSLRGAAPAGTDLSKFSADISSMVGDKVEDVIGKLGFRTDQGAVQTNVRLQIENRLIPTRLVSYVSGFEGNQLDLTFNDSFYLYHDTWRAWREGAHPSDTYPRVQALTHERVKQVAYLGLAKKESGVLNTVGKFLKALRLDYPLDNQYIQDSVLIQPVTASGRYGTLHRGQTRTVPGDVLQALYWLDDTSACFGNSSKAGNNCRFREPPDVTRKRGMINSSGATANWPMRAYNCRGDFFQGAADSDEPEFVYSINGTRKYFNYGENACE
jgi:hypothetical protein